MKWRVQLLAAVLSVCSSTPVAAVIVAGDYANVSDAAVNITPPSSDPGFYNVGIVGSASAIYLGTDGSGGAWVLSAKHVTLGATTFRFPDPADSTSIVSATYSIVTNSAIVLTNPSGPYAGTTSDLILYKIDPNSSAYGAPNLPNLDIATSSPVGASAQYPGDPVLAIGRGMDRAASQTFWDNAMPTWHTTTAANALNTGYLVNGSQQIRWGDNLVAQSGNILNVGTIANPVYIQSFTTKFDQYRPNPADPAHSGNALMDEFQATLGDSGGATFSWVDGKWLLSGMIDATTVLTGQPSSTSVFGDTTIMADLSFYRSALLARVPMVGDANGDGVVNGLDISVIASHWLGSGPSGDVNHDGIVNGLDVSLVASRWGVGAALPGAALASAVPEPSTWQLCAAILGGLLCLTARRLCWSR